MFKLFSEKTIFFAVFSGWLSQWKNFGAGGTGIGY
jgi:hypothetical protein